MSSVSLMISKATQRRFVLGKQGLYPGRRWRGKEGAAQAMREGCVVQIDPLNVVARSHDIALHSRVLGYDSAHLNALLYEDRAFFDWGGTVRVHPMEELPYWRVAMDRKRGEPRRAAFAAEHARIIDSVRAEISTRGPLGARDFSGESLGKEDFRSGKDTSQALYHLWLAGELMTHGRRGFDRIYDLRERVAPPHLNHSASPDEAEEFFALKVLRQSGVATLPGWRGRFAGTIGRRVDRAEASARLEALLESGEVARIGLEGDSRTPRFVLVEDLPALEILHSGGLPEEWRPLDSSTAEEMIFLAPLEIVSARGRSLPLFGFEYLWEVYKPRAKRRWGYYTLPILYHDRLVARFDSKLDRPSRTLTIKGLWLEENIDMDEPFIAALTSGFVRFMEFVGAEEIKLPETAPATLRKSPRLRNLNQSVSRND